MKALIEVIKVYPHLKRLIYFVPKKPLVAIYDTFRVTINNNNMEIFCFDGSRSIKCNVRCESEISGSWAIPAKLLTETLSLINEPMVSFEFTEQHVVIKSGRKNLSKIHIHPGSDYPSPRECDKNNEISYTCSDFKRDALNMAAFTDKDSQKIAFQGVHIKMRDGEIYFEAANDFIAGQVKTEPRSIIKWDNILVPGEMMKLVADSLDDRDIVKLYHDGKQICFSTSNYEISSTVIDNKYMDVDVLFNKFSKGQYIKVDNYQAEMAFKKIKMYASDEIPFLCTMTFSGQEMKLEGIDVYFNNMAEEYIDLIENQDVNTSISCRADQLLSVVKAVGQGDLLFFINSPEQPMYMRAAASDSNRFLISAIKK